MIKHFKVTNHLGESLVIELRSPEKSGFFIRRIDGLGPVKSIVNMTEVAASDGAFYNSSRLSPRNIVLDLGFYPDGLDSIETIRMNSYRFFPRKRLLTFDIETDSRAGVVTGYVETNEPDIFSKESGTQISILCESAYFYSRDTIVTTFNGVTDLFECPFENPSLTESLIQFSAIFNDTEQSIFYSGDDEVGINIQIYFTGAVNNLLIYNATTGQVFGIDPAKLIAQTGENLKAGDRVTISTFTGNKFISLFRNGITTNILNSLAAGSDWLTLTRGDNIILYTTDPGQSGNLQMVIYHKIFYGGL